MSRLRYVLDTNVIISALLFPRSVPGIAFTKTRQHGDLLLSSETVGELVEVLSRAKFDPYVTPDERDWFIAVLVKSALLVEPSERVEVCRDPKDNKWLELAIAGQASTIVSGDEDLIALDGYREISIVTPAEFVERFASR